jgi:RND family efflux transporter MFP subunit
MASVVALSACQSDYPAPGTSQKADGAGPAPRQVRAIPAGEGTMTRGVTVTGTLAAEEQVVLGLKVAGRLSEIPVDLGSPVHKGQMVARVDPTDFRLRVEQSEASLRQARARLGLPPEGSDDRVDSERTAIVRQARSVLTETRLNRERQAMLFEQQLVSQAQLDTAVATMQVAEGRYQDAVEEVRNRQAILAQRRTEMKLAQQQLADTVLTAPIDGAVRERHSSVGEFHNAGTPVVTLVRVHPLRLRLAVPERAAPGIRIGQTVRITVEGDATVYTGRVARLSPTIQEQNRTLLVEAEVPNEQGQLRAGAFARGEILSESTQTVVLVPASSIVTFAGIAKVLSVKDGKSVEKRVQTGRREGDLIEIAEGVKAGELVVVEPGNLVGGQPVTIIQ